MAKASAAGNEDATTTQVERLIDWQSITNWGGYLQAAGLSQEDVQQASDVLGDGFAVYTKDGRDALVNVPMLVIDWTFFDSDYKEGEKAVYVRAMTREGKKVAFTDGSSGICATLTKYTQRTGNNTGPILTNGLVKREFDTEDDKGKTVHVTLYDFDTREYKP